MPSPSTSIATQRPDIVGSFMEFDLALNRAGFISSKVFPTFEVATQAGVFGRIPLKELLKKRETARAPGSGYSRQDWKFQPDSYACFEHGAEEVVDDRTSKMYQNYFRAELVAAERARSAVLRNAELRVIALIGSGWSGDTSAAGNGWGTASGTPLADVEAAIQAIHTNSGMMANTIVMSWKKFRDITNNPELLDRIKYSGHQNPSAGAITRQAVATALNLETVLVSGSMQNTANEGQAAVLASLWTETEAFVCKVALSIDIEEPCIGRVFHWGEDGSQIGGLVETYREEGVRGDIQRVRHDVDEKLLYEAAGSQITAV